MKKTKSNAKYAKALKRKVAEEYLSGKFSYAVGAEEYGLSNGSVVKEFVKWYRKNYDLEAMKKKEAGPGEPSNSMLGPSVDEESVQRIKELEKALAQAKLKLAGLEAMIDVAEQDLGIAIRKKSGTKPSN